jgi:hypothetical protein
MKWSSAPCEEGGGEMSADSGVVNSSFVPIMCSKSSSCR